MSRKPPRRWQFLGNEMVRPGHMGYRLAGDMGYSWQWSLYLNVSLKSETEALESRFERWDFWQSQRPFALGTA